jgi:hypothetical protein
MTERRDRAKMVGSTGRPAGEHPRLSDGIVRELVDLLARALVADFEHFPDLGPGQPEANDPADKERPATPRGRTRSPMA